MWTDERRNMAHAFLSNKQKRNELEKGSEDRAEPARTNSLMRWLWIKKKLRRIESHKKTHRKPPTGS